VTRSLRAWWREGEGWYLAVGLANLALGTSTVLVPLMVSEVLNRSVGAVGILSAMVSLTGVLGSLIWGRLSDVADRRKPFVILSYSVVGLSLAAIASVNSFSGLLLFNMLLGFFWVANAAVTVLIVIENRDADAWERKIGQLNQIGAIGWLAGLGIGGAAIAAATDWWGEAVAIRAVFLFIAAVSIVAAVLAARWIPKTKPKFKQRRFRGVILALGNFLAERGRFAPFHLYHRVYPGRLWAAVRQPLGFRPGTRRFLAATLVAFTALGLFGIPLPFLLTREFGIPPSVVFLYFAVQHIGIVVAFPLAARRIKRKGNRRVQMGALLIRFGLFASAAGFLARTSDAPPTWVLVAGFLVYGLTWSYFQLSGVALTSRLAKRQNRGLALGLYNALAGMGWILAGLASSLLTEWGGFQTAYAASAALLLLSVAILVLVPNPAPPGGRKRQIGSHLEHFAQYVSRETGPHAREHTDPRFAQGASREASRA
jgi:MFS family permease